MKSALLETVIEERDAACRERDAWIETAREFSHSVEYYQGLLDNIAEHFGEAAYISDDGSLQDSPLRAKLPDLVSDLYRKAHCPRVIFLISPTSQ